MQLCNNEQIIVKLTYRNKLLNGVMIGLVYITSSLSGEIKKLDSSSYWRNTDESVLEEYDVT